MQSTSSTGDVLTLHLNTVDPNAEYFIEVQGATSDVFGIGSYGLSVSFDANSTVTTSGIDAVLRGPYQSLDPNDINAIFVGTTDLLLNSDNGANDTAGTATQLSSLAGLRAELALRSGRKHRHADRFGLLPHPESRQSACRAEPGADRHRARASTSTERPRASRSSTAAADRSRSRSSPTARGCSRCKPAD